MAERLRSAIETLFNVRDETNGLAPSGEERRRRRNESIGALRAYSVPALFLLAGAGVLAAAAHFVVWSLVGGILMPLLYSAVPGLEAVNVGGGAPLRIGQFIAYVLYAAGMVGIAVVVLRAVLAKPSGYVRERTRTCPACGMTVLEAASRCRYCGSPLAARRAYPAPVSRGIGPTLSSPRPSAEADRADRADRGDRGDRADRGDRGDRGDRPPRRGRRGGRRRGGRDRSRPGGGGPGPGPGSGGTGASSGAPTGASSTRSDT